MRTRRLERTDKGEHAVVNSVQKMNILYYAPAKFFEIKTPSELRRSLKWRAAQEDKCQFNGILVIQRVQDWKKTMVRTHHSSVTLILLSLPSRIKIVDVNGSVRRVDLR